MTDTKHEWKVGDVCKNAVWDGIYFIVRFYDGPMSENGVQNSCALLFNADWQRDVIDGGAALSNLRLPTAAEIADALEASATTFSETSLDYKKHRNRLRNAEMLDEETTDEQANSTG